MSKSWKVTKEIGERFRLSDEQKNVLLTLLRKYEDAEETILREAAAVEKAAADLADYVRRGLHAQSFVGGHAAKLSEAVALRAERIEQLNLISELLGVDSRDVFAVYAETKEV